MKNINQHSSRRAHVVALALASAAGFNCACGQIPYPDSGTPNPVTYTFTATTTGNVTAYFAGSGAAFDEQVGMFDVTASTFSGFGLDDHSSALGQSFSLGSVTAGDTLVFVDQVYNSDYPPGPFDVYSVPTSNIPYDSIDGGGSLSNHNHVYSVSASANEAYSGSPVGTYVAFEDLPFPRSDYNYFDDTFVFTDVSTTKTTVPDGASTLTLLAAGIAALLMLSCRIRRAGALR